MGSTFRDRVILLFSLSLLLASASVCVALDSPDTINQSQKGSFDKAEGQVNVEMLAAADKTITNTWKQNFDAFAGLFMRWLRSRGLNINHYLIQMMAPIMFKVLLPLYLLLITLTGIYLTWGAISPNMRAQTKGQLQKLVIGLILCSISLPIYQLLLDINNFAVDEILATTTSTVGDHWEDTEVPASITGSGTCVKKYWNIILDHPWIECDDILDYFGVDEETYGVDWSLYIREDMDNPQIKHLMFKESVNGPYDVRVIPDNYEPITGLFYYHKTGVGLGAGLMGTFMLLTGGKGSAIITPLMCMLFSMMIMPYLVLAIRYVVVIAFGILFPFTLFCQSFEFLKTLGDKLMKQTLMWIFFPTAMALFTVLSVAIANSPGDWMVNAIASLAAFLLIGAAPMMITGMMGVAGGLMLYAGQTMGNPRLVFMANILQGQSSSAFTQAAFMSTRTMSRLQRPADTAKAYTENITEGRPKDATVVQPPSPNSPEYMQAMRELGDGATGVSNVPIVYGGPSRVVGEFGDGIGAYETAMRAAFGRPVAAGTSIEHMTAQQYTGIMFAKAGGFSSGMGWVWYGYGLAGNLSPKKLMVPAGYMLKGLVRQSLHDWPIGKTLSGIADRMTGYWQIDKASGEWAYNYGWQSYLGISRDLAQTSAEFSKAIKPGSGAPAWVKAAMTGVGLTMPLTLLALPVAPVVGLAIAGTAAVTFGGGYALLRPIGEQVADNRAVASKIQGAAKVRSGIMEKFAGSTGLGKEEVWGQLTEAERNSFGEDEAVAKDRAFAFYGDKGGPLLGQDEIFGIVSEGDRDDSRKRMFGWQEGMDEGSLGAVKESAAKYYASAANYVPMLDINPSLYTVGPEAGVAEGAAGLGGVRSRRQWDERLGGAVRQLQQAREDPQQAGKALAVGEGMSAEDWEKLPETDKNQYGIYAVAASEEHLEDVKEERRAAFDMSGGRDAAARGNWDFLDSRSRERYRAAARGELAAAGVPVTEANVEAMARYRAFSDGKEESWSSLGGDLPQLQKGALWDSLSPDERQAFIDKAKAADPAAGEAEGKGIAMAQAQADPGRDDPGSMLERAKEQALRTRTMGRAEDFSEGFFGRRRQKRVEDYWQGLSDSRKDDLIVAASEGRYDSGSLESAPAAQKESIRRSAKEKAYREGGPGLILSSMGAKQGVGAGIRGSSVGRFVQALRPSVRGERDARDGAKGGQVAKSIAISVALGIPFAGVGGPLMYDLGRARYQEKVETRGTVEYGRARMATRKGLQGFKLHEEPSTSGSPMLSDGKGRTYSLESDGVHFAEDKWGAGRRKATMAEADEVKEWHSQNKNVAEARKTEAGGSHIFEPAREGAILSGMEGDGLGKDGESTGRVGLAAIDEWKRLIDGDNDPSGMFERRIQQYGPSVGEALVGRMSTSERRRFGWSRLESRREKAKAGMRALSYFLQRRREGGGRA